MDEMQSLWRQQMTVRQQWQVVRRIARFAQRYQWLFLRAIFWYVAVAVANALLPVVIQSYMDHTIEPQRVTGYHATIFLLVYVGGTFAKFGMMYRKQVLFQMASERTVAQLRDDLYQRLGKMGMRYFDQTPAGSIVSRVTSDTETIKRFWEVFFALAEGVLTVGSTLVAMAYLDKGLASMFLVYVPMMLGIVYGYQRYSTRIYGAMREQLSLLTVQLHETLSGMAIVQQFRQQHRMQARFEATNQDYTRQFFRIIHLKALLLMPVIDLLLVFGLVTILGYFGHQAAHQGIAVGVLYAFTAYARQMFQLMGRLLDQLSNLQEGIVASSRVLALMDLPDDAPIQTPDEQACIREGTIVFDRVCFGYDPQRPVLHDISFTVKKGETLAIVGHTGSGKSSIINVLLRFYEFQSGRITIDGYDIRSIPLAQLRRQIGLVLQDPFLFYGDIEQNLRMFDTELTSTHIRDAATFVQAHQFIERLPNGYQQAVRERGSGFSSGEKQLLSFARTIVRQPQILILDEATATVDTETEEAIQHGLHNMRQNRTTIAIAHRLSTIKDAQHILVLDRGRIVEHGTHDQLLALKGSYYTMYQLQTYEQQS